MTAQDLPAAELDVMTCLWERGPQTARAVRETLEDARPMTHSSVCTLLNRLAEKGLVTREKGRTGKAFVYSAAVAPTKTRRRLVGDLLDRVFGGSGVELVASLLESRPPTATELDELQQLLDDLKARKCRRRPQTKRR